MRRSIATAVWRGDLKKGEGRFSADSGAFEGDYSAATRFEEAAGTNPEELLAAAHAACFSMALANVLSERGHDPDVIETRAYCTMERVDGAFTISTMRLVTRGRARDADDTSFREAAEAAKDACPVSRALQGNLEIELDAALES